MNVTNFDERKKELARLNKLLRKYNQQRLYLLSQCEHAELEFKRDYISGDYLNTGYSTTWEECTVCGKRFDVVSKSDGMYG